MLATPSDPFDSGRHLFEIKWDGARCVLFLRGNEIRLQNRRLLDISARYPDLLDLHRAIRARTAVLDGELVVLSEGKSDFPKLQRREHVSDPFKIGLLTRELPATYVAFDILYRNGRSLLREPLSARKEILHRAIGEAPNLLESQGVVENGRAFFEKCVGHGLEGVVAKALSSPYLVGKRSRYWRKIKPRHTAVCFIVGYTPGRGERQESFGALLLATPEGEGWRYRGRVGTGLKAAEREEIRSRLGALQTAEPPVCDPPDRKGMRWLEPRLRCEVSYHEITQRGSFRAPVFRRLVR
jgi:DNA ligase D-like protein (predicted ligase)